MKDFPSLPLTRYTQPDLTPVIFTKRIVKDKRKEATQHTLFLPTKRKMAGGPFC